MTKGGSGRRYPFPGPKRPTKWHTETKALCKITHVVGTRKLGGPAAAETRVLKSKRTVTVAGGLLVSCEENGRIARNGLAMYFILSNQVRFTTQAVAEYWTANCRISDMFTVCRSDSESIIGVAWAGTSSVESLSRRRLEC